MNPQVLELSDVTFERIVRAIHDTFSSVLSLPVQASATQNGPVKGPPRSISGFVILKNPDVQGTFSINFPNETALKIFSAFYGTELNQVDERVLEGVGEITNMVYGCFKKTLNEEGHDLQMFIPFIVIGSEFNHMNELTPQNTINIDFSSTAGSFWIEFNVQKTAARKMLKVA